ncbi:hypothetical protein DAMA08_047900 [Martiniozyma asiatica (nom. inval.)]|nr:hypothetical protein DAMA08_047900 [Martiniozyma asiatica]
MNRLIRSSIQIRQFHNSPYTLKRELPRPSTKYLADVGEQPTPETTEEVIEKEVADIPIPASQNEKLEIKAAMKKRSLKMTFWQIFLITIIGSSTLNVMRMKNEMEDLQESFQRKIKVYDDLISEAQCGEAVVEDVKPRLEMWANRLSTHNVEPLVVNGPAGLDKQKLMQLMNSDRKNSEIVSTDEQPRSSSKPLVFDNEPKEKLDRFL